MDPMEIDDSIHVKRNLTMEGLVTKEGPCQGGWTKFGCSCYYLTVQNRTWTESRDYCISQGGDLAIINSRDEQVFVNGLLGLGEYAWIGLTDSVTEGTWKWVDGTPVTTTFWQEGQPNSHEGKNQDCVEFWPSATGGGWNDEKCSVSNLCICEQ
ncbi:CD209 antigen-like protein A [Tautogolabrus adspersus]